MGQLIIPKTNVQNLSVPLIFLAGPIGSAPNWQDEAVEYLFSREQNLAIASPRWGIRDKISKYMVVGNDIDFPRVRAWERHYLDVAAKTGAIMFWFPGEEKHRCEKVYGAMTRFEAGLVLGWYRYNKDIKFCFGTDGKFSEFNTIFYDFKLDAPEKEICNSLEETCDNALSLVYRK